jgi:NADH dehydrogenase FAD-containing subunit
MQNTASKRAFIPGRGFAGLTVAMELGKKLAQNPVVDVMLVNRENFFLFTHGLRYRGSPTFALRISTSSPN